MTERVRGDIMSSENLNLRRADIIWSEKGQSFEELKEIIEQRCGMEEFLRQMKFGQSRLKRLLCGETEFKQSDMLRAAKILNLSSGEFNRCFFGSKVQKN